jgi:hypothetical protein
MEVAHAMDHRNDEVMFGSKQHLIPDGFLVAKDMPLART